LYKAESLPKYGQLLGFQAEIMQSRSPVPTLNTVKTIALVDDGWKQCWGSGSGIQCFFDIWIRDPREKNPRSGIRDYHPGSYFIELSNNCWVKILKFSVADQDPGNGSEDPHSGSGINIRIRNSGWTVIPLHLARVSDPHWFNADLDPADPDSGSGCRVWWPKIEKKLMAGNLIYIFLIKNCNLLIPRPPLRTLKLQEKPSALKREHPVVQYLKTWKFWIFFLFLWVIFALLDPDPSTQINADPEPCILQYVDLDLRSLFAQPVPDSTVLPSQNKY
jgi:hypothetical protein